MSSEAVCAKIFVSGKVQGVYYRDRYASGCALCLALHRTPAVSVCYQTPHARTLQLREERNHAWVKRAGVESGGRESGDKLRGP